MRASQGRGTALQAGTRHDEPVMIHETYKTLRSRTLAFGLLPRALWEIFAGWPLRKLAAWLSSALGSGLEASWDRPGHPVLVPALQKKRAEARAARRS